MTEYKNAYIYNTGLRSFEFGSLFVQNGCVTVSGKADEVVDLGGAYLIPGLIDVHTHGRDGFGTTESDAEGILEMARSYAKVGTTSFMPAIMSVPLADIRSSIANIAAAIEKNGGTSVGANILGIHLEGRYLNPERNGAHNKEYLAPLDADELAGLIGSFRDSVSNPEAYGFHITCAPELEGGEAFIKRAVELGATVSIGHSDATISECQAAMEWGADSFTHLYNAMSPLSHRSPGCVGAGLSSDAYTELICDGKHISPEVVRLTYRAKAKNKLVLITDSSPAAGLPDGNYNKHGTDFIVGNGAAWLPDGTLTGSVISMFTAVKNLAEFAEIPLTDAVACATINPARMVGADGTVGSLEIGKRADFIVTDADFGEIESVYIGGFLVE